MSDPRTADLLPCSGSWYGEGCLSSINLTKQYTPHKHADGELHVRCLGKDGCLVPGHTEENHRERIGSRFD